MRMSQLEVIMGTGSTQNQRVLTHQFQVGTGIDSTRFGFSFKKWKLGIPDSGFGFDSSFAGIGN